MNARRLITLVAIVVCSHKSNVASGVTYKAVLLHPSNGFIQTSGNGISDGLQVGYGFGPATQGASHALLWSGTANSFVDLNPTGFANSEALKASVGGQVGYGQVSGTGKYHALMWGG